MPAVATGSYYLLASTPMMPTSGGAALPGVAPGGGAGGATMG
jgi:hypothetical protein